MKIVVMSCDKNDDLFPLFYHCIEKYWPDHPEVIYSTETKTNPYYKTICKNYDINSWTRRVRETIQEIDDEFILLMVDDIFIRQKVDHEFVMGLTKYFDDKTAAVHLERSWDWHDKPVNNVIKLKDNNGLWITTAMCSIYKKDKFIQILSRDESPWEFEHQNKHLNFKYYNTVKEAFDFGKRPNLPYGWRFALVRGKWMQECIDFFKKEGIIINYNLRGMHD